VKAGDVIATNCDSGFETVYLLLRPDPTRGSTRWECLVLHREDERWPRGKPGHVVWPSERELSKGAMVAP